MAHPEVDGATVGQISPDGVAFTNVVLRLAVHHGPRKSPWGKRGVIYPKTVSGQSSADQRVMHR